MVNEGLLTNLKLVELLWIRDHYQSQFHKYPYDIQKRGGTSLACQFRRHI